MQEAAFVAIVIVYAILIIPLTEKVLDFLWQSGYWR